MRSRASSLPRSCCRATAFSEPACAAASPSSRSQASFSAVVSCRADIRAEPNPRRTTRRLATVRRVVGEEYELDDDPERIDPTPSTGT